MAFLLPAQKNEKNGITSSFFSLWEKLSVSWRELSHIREKPKYTYTGQSRMCDEPSHATLLFTLDQDEGCSFGESQGRKLDLS